MSDVSSNGSQRSDRSDSWSSNETFNSELFNNEYDSDGYLTDGSSFSSGSNSSVVSFISDDSINCFEETVAIFAKFLPNLEIEINGSKKSFRDSLHLIMQSVFDGNILFAEKFLFILTNTISLNMFLFVNYKDLYKLKKSLDNFIDHLNIDIRGSHHINKNSFFSCKSCLSEDSKFYLIKSIKLIKKLFPNMMIKGENVKLNDLLVIIGVTIIAGQFEYAKNYFLILLNTISFDARWIYLSWEQKVDLQFSLFDFVNSLNDEAFSSLVLQHKFFF